MAVQELLISSDSHVDVKPEQVKQRLASKYHEEYDAGVATLASEAAKIMQSNMQREQALRQPQVNPARGTPGHSDPEARGYASMFRNWIARTGRSNTAVSQAAD